MRQKNTLPFESNVHLHGGYVPAAHDGHPMDVIAAGELVRLPLPQRSGRRDALVPRPRARPHLAHALLRARSAMYVLEDELERELGPAAGRVRRADRDRRPRVQQGRLVPLRGERRPRLPRRHDPRQRRGLAAHDGAAAQVPLPLPQRLQRPLLHAAAGQRPADAADRRRRRAALASRSRARVYLFHPAERIDLVLDFSAYGPGRASSSCTTRTGSAAPCRSCASTSQGGRGSEDFTVPSRMREPERLPAANARRTLGPRARHGRVADQRARLRPEPHRRPAARGSTEITRLNQ